MPEKLPTVEHIDVSRQRLKDMSYPFAGSLVTPAVRYPLPERAGELQELVQIVKTYPGAEMVMIGEQWYRVSSGGGEALHTFFSRLVRESSSTDERLQ